MTENQKKQELGLRVCFGFGRNVCYGIDRRKNPRHV